MKDACDPSSPVFWLSPGRVDRSNRFNVGQNDLANYSLICRGNIYAPSMVETISALPIGEVHTHKTTFKAPRPNLSSRPLR